MSVDALVPRVRKALGVSNSFDDEEIPALIRSSIQRLLRDYHFPKAVQREEFTNLFINSQEFTLPDGFKKELAVQFYDPAASPPTWSDPLRKVEGFRRPSSTGYPTVYWLEGLKLWLDTPLPADMIGNTLQLFYESQDVTLNEDWITEDFEDTVRLFSIVRGAPDFRKPEILQTYTPLWADERESLAIYLNELEWTGSQMYMHEARPIPLERYPAS